MKNKTEEPLTLNKLEQVLSDLMSNKKRYTILASGDYWKKIKKVTK